MKKLILMIPVCLISGILYAQKIIEKHISFTQKESVSLNIQIADSIRIVPWDKDEVYLWASVNINDNKNNDLYLWKFDDSGNEVNVQARLADKDAWPENRANCCCCETRIWCEVHVPPDARLSVETINGDLIFTGNLKEIRAKTISGFIDLTAPENLKADMGFKTVTGLVYTNFVLNTGERHRSGATHFTSSLNGGGSPISLETISGNIYFRKAD